MDALGGPGAHRRDGRTQSADASTDRKRSRADVTAGLAWLSEVENEIRRGRCVNPSSGRLLFGACVDDWLAQRYDMAPDPGVVHQPDQAPPSPRLRAGTADRHHDGFDPPLARRHRQGTADHRSEGLPAPACGDHDRRRRRAHRGQPVRTQGRRPGAGPGTEDLDVGDSRGDRHRGR
jgi:hypothetical protein